MAQKFSERERRLVIKFLEEHLGSRLTPVAQFRTYFNDATGTRYLILGATGDWHGIPKKVVDIEETISSAENDLSDNRLVIGRLLRTKIVVYWGSLGSLLQQKHRLTQNQKRDYQFDTRQKAYHLEVKQTGLKLSKLGEIPLSWS